MPVRRTPPWRGRLSSGRSHKRAAVADGLSKGHGVVIKRLPDGEGGTPLVRNALRISHHAFNSEAQLDGFAKALTAVLDGVCGTAASAA